MHRLKNFDCINFSSLCALDEAGCAILVLFLEERSRRGAEPPCNLQEKDMNTCMRCGLCCKGQYCQVPKFEYSDLSPGHLDHIYVAEGLEAVRAYMKENSMSQGERCYWLEDQADGSTSCRAYERRPGACRNYNPDGACTIWMAAFGLV